MELRPYQTAAVQAVYDHLRRRDDNPVVVAPTGSGKSILIAQVVKDAVLRWNGRVLVLTHVRELIEQNADKLRRLCPELRIGIYSAGLNRRDTDASVIVAGIQSVYRRAAELAGFDLILVDEAHLIPASGEGMYREFLGEARAVNPSLRVVGLTATPFRLDCGSICRPDHFLNAICYEIGIKQLIADGFLSPLVSQGGRVKVDTSGLRVRAGEFVADDVEALMDADDIVEAACAEIVELTQDRQAVLIFTAGIRHGIHVQRVLQDKHDVECGFVSGETPATERDEVLARFRRDAAPGLFERKPLKYLANCNLLTTGFDAPIVDCVVLLRPTASPVLYCQAVGRGFRLHPGKRDCLVLDYGGNVLRHGPVDQVRVAEKSSGNGESPAKECPKCRLLIAAGYRVCPRCGHEFPAPERERHEPKASHAGVLSGQVSQVEFDVRDVAYSVHQKRGAPDDAPRTFRVDYRLGLDYWASEWICFEHTGWARRKAEQWWKRRSPDPVPDTAERAVELAEAGALALTEQVTVRSVAGEKFEQIVGYKLGPLPEPSPAHQEPDFEEVPF